MLDIVDEDYLNSVRAFADKIELRHQLEEKLEYLDTYAEHGERGLTVCRLMKDFAPHSFYFVMTKKNSNGDYDYYFNGGLIFHGAGDSGVDFPTLSVRLGDISKAGWSIHT